MSPPHGVPSYARRGRWFIFETSRLSLFNRSDRNPKSLDCACVQVQSTHHWLPRTARCNILGDMPRKNSDHNAIPQSLVKSKSKTSTRSAMSRKRIVAKVSRYTILAPCRDGPEAEKHRPKPWYRMHARASTNRAVVWSSCRIL
jgi:hypothetical protein